MLMRYAITNEIDDRARSKLCNELINGNTNINLTEINITSSRPFIHQQNNSRIHVHVKALVVGNSTRIAEVVDTHELSLSHD